MQTLRTRLSTMTALVLLAGILPLLTLFHARTLSAQTPRRPTFSQPNLFTLSGQQIHISYSTSGIDGKPHFGYKDAHQELNFSGEQIRVTPSADLGNIVSVTTHMTVDAGSTTFSVLIPSVNLAGPGSDAINSDGITTIHRFSIVPKSGQTEIYTVTHLTGTASRVVF